jgi:hypothetical protein
MGRITLVLLVFVASIVTEPVPVKGRDLKPTQSTHTGSIHRGCVEFQEMENVVSKGPITLVKVCHGGYIHGLQLFYGGHEGGWHGLRQADGPGLTVTPWSVPEGERIVRVDGEIAKNPSGFLYLSRLQFITNRGKKSPWFGRKRGTPFEAADPNGLPLRTISGWVNLRRHPSLNRAIASLTFYFDPTGPVPRKPKVPDLGPTDFTHTGSVHNGCVEFREMENVVSKGPITLVKVCHGGYIHGLQLFYGGYEGGWHGLKQADGPGLTVTPWSVPEGERIVRVKGEIAKNPSGFLYLSRLQFITDRGTRSQWFGRNRGTPFEAADPSGLPLRTISGWVNLRRHPSLNRAIASLTLQFGQPCYEPYEPADDHTKVKYLKMYAPRVWFNHNEQYWPSSVEWSFHFLKRYWSDDSNRWWLVVKEPLQEPSSVLDYFHGADPQKQWTHVPLKLEDVPAYAFWHEVYPDTVDLVYFFYYPYNRGKAINIAFGTVMGNHVSDWEHVTVRLTAKRDSQGRTRWAPSADAQKLSFSLAYHSYDARYAWVNMPKVQDTDHPIIYSAWGSHGSYASPGRHKYESVVGQDLVDYTEAGTAWDTWKKLEFFDYDVQKGLGPTWKGMWPNWLRKDKGNKDVGNGDPASGPVWRWGNYRWKEVAGSGYYRLEHGPTGPADKPYFGTHTLD